MKYNAHTTAQCNEHVSTPDFGKRVFVGIYFYIYCDNYYFSFCTRTVTYVPKTEKCFTKWVCTVRYKN